MFSLLYYSDSLDCPITVELRYQDSVSGNYMLYTGDDVTLII